MDNKLDELIACYNKLFTDENYSNSYIELLDSGDLVLSANQVGYTYIIGQILKLCKNQSPNAHFHLDDAGMADKCEKGLIIQYTNAPWN